MPHNQNKSPRKSEKENKKTWKHGRIQLRRSATLSVLVRPTDFARTRRDVPAPRANDLQPTARGKDSHDEAAGMKRVGWSKKKYVLIVSRTLHHMDLWWFIYHDSSKS